MGTLKGSPTPPRMEPIGQGLPASDTPPLDDAQAIGGDQTVAPTPSGRRRRKRRKRSGVTLSAEALLTGGLIGLCSVLVVAPLAAGGVHRVPMLLIIAGALSATVLTVVALGLNG